MNEFLKTEWWDNFDRDLYYRIRKIKSIKKVDELVKDILDARMSLGGRSIAPKELINRYESELED
jgi:hypothetical protein